MRIHVESHLLCSRGGNWKNASLSAIELLAPDIPATSAAESCRNPAGWFILGTVLAKVSGIDWSL
jgi:hypothetical protein